MPIGNTYPARPGGIQGDELFLTFTGDDTYNESVDDMKAFMLAEHLTDFDHDLIATALQSETDPVFLQVTADSKGLSGFIDGDNIVVTYSHTNRTITLTGDLRYLFRGVEHELTSPWVSSAHTASNGRYFLFSIDGTTFAWSTNAWEFQDVMVAAVNYNTSNLLSFAIRETHKLMNYETHRELHDQIGTYKSSGGILTAGTYIEDTPTDAANTPGFDTAILEDEDLKSTVNAWTEGLYTTAYVGVGSVLVFDTTKTRPFHDAGTNTYIQVNNTVTGTMVAGGAGNFYNVYQVLVPVCTDSDSQKYRMIMLQPQATHNNLDAALAEDVRTLKLGDFATLFTEFVIHARITYRTRSADSNAGRCRIETGGVTYIAGSKISQINVSGFTTNSHSNLSPATLAWLLSKHTGTANTIPYFDATGIAAEMTTIPVGFLPSYVDDVLEYATSGDFPVPGETGKIYIAQDTNASYRWTGSVYVMIVADLAAAIHGATSKTTPADADELGMVDSADSNLLKKLTWANLKTALASLWETVAHAASSKTTPVDSDELSITDSATSYTIKKLTWANLKTTLASVFVPMTTGRTTHTTTGSLQTSDNKKIIEFNNSGAGFTFTINSKFDGFTCDLVNLNVGDITLAQGTATILYINANRKLTEQFQAVSIYFYSDTACVIIGTLNA
jgi:hypothetical protein